MLKILKSVTLIASLLLTPALQADEARIHYMGFNAFAADKAKSGRAFDAYLEKLAPIMKRYGMTADAYNVMHGGSDNLKADVVTFGTAKDQASFQAFFQDAEFQAIFPMLFGALEDHQVIFTGGVFMPSPKDGTHTLLSASWFKGDSAAAMETIAGAHKNMKPVFEKYGVQMMAHTAGVYANQGLAADVKDTHAPQLLELWSVKDAHGFFDDPMQVEANNKVKALLSRSEDFWIVKRPIKGHGGHHAGH